MAMSKTCLIKLNQTELNKLNKSILISRIDLSYELHFLLQLPGIVFVGGEDILHAIICVVSGFTSDFLFFVPSDVDSRRLRSHVTSGTIRDNTTTIPLTTHWKRERDGCRVKLRRVTDRTGKRIFAYKEYNLYQKVIHFKWRKILWSFYSLFPNVSCDRYGTFFFSRTLLGVSIFYV